MKVLVSGGRDFYDCYFMSYYLDKFNSVFPFTKLINGGAKGLDCMAAGWAAANNIDCVFHPVSEYEWKTIGLSAGHKRNKMMLDVEQPDFVMIFPGGNGTEGMRKLAEDYDCVTWVSKYIYFKKEDPETFFCSNFYEHEIVDNDGLIWPSTEHYYQAYKSYDEKYRSAVQMCSSPNEAKKKGREAILTDDWEKGRKDIVMKDALDYKFAFGTDISEKLINTEDHYLVEYAPWGDTYWGVDKHFKGNNKLGKLLMRKRELLKNEKEGQTSPKTILYPWC